MASGSILERIMRFNALKWKNGQLLLFNMPMILGACQNEMYKHEMIRLNQGYEVLRDTLYESGSFQGRYAYKLLTKKFGFAKTITSKSKFLDFFITQSEFTGHGPFKWTKKDFTNNEFAGYGTPTYGKVYKECIGKSKDPVDDQIRGVASALISELVGKDIIGIETECIAKGSKVCSFIFKERKKWDLSDPKVARQMPQKIKKPKEISVI